MTKKKKSSALPTPDRYLEFLRHVTLHGIGLESANVRVDRNALAEATASKTAADISVDAQFKVIQNNAQTLVVAAAFALKQLVEHDEHKTVLSIECSFSALFNVEISVDTETADRFADNEAKVIFWPYLRHFVSDTSYRMAITPVLLPLITSARTPDTSEK